MRAMICWLATLLLLCGAASLATAAGEEPVAAPDAAAVDQTGDYGMNGDLPFGEEEEELVVWDPIEPVNRGLFWFNDKLYFYLFKPVARGLRIVPEPVRIGLDNVFDNLKMPIRFANSLLQLKPKKAGTDLVRFFVNSTMGLAGLFDVASDAGIPSSQEDFGQTLGRYGSGPGFYLVLPILGPSNLRDGIGRIGDHFLNPLTYYLETEEMIVLRASENEIFLSLDKDTYEGIKRDSLDPYLFIRDAYAQRRQGAIEK